MIEIDVVMLSCSKNHTIKKMTQDAIFSLYSSSTEYKFNVYLIETIQEKVCYEGVKEIIQPKTKFNYNAFLNIGFAKCTSEFVVISNNDVIFHKNWFEEIIKVNVDSATPFSPGWGPHQGMEGKIIEGYRTGIELGGWCIVAKKSTLDKIGKFDEQFDLYHQDDDYGMQLQKHKLVHKFVGTSKVTHLLGKTAGVYGIDKHVNAKLLESAAKFNAKYRSTICLNMIVRDESKIILEALNGIYKFINYWVIVDTGSLDNTKEIIKDFFKEKGIPGELHERPWINFAHNRTEALNLAKSKCDYTIVMDADDIITGTPIFTNLRLDCYNIRHGDSFHYDRVQVFKSILDWKYIGVVHEAPVCADAKTSGRIEGNYQYISRTMGFRSRDPLKYQHDAEILEAELIKEPNNTRYWFYLGQSYFDYNNPKESKRAYAKRVELGGWNEEVFYAQFRVGQCCIRLNEPIENVILELLKSFNFRPTRAEPLVTLSSYLRSKQLINMAYPFALAATQIPYPSKDVLFIYSEVYEYRALDELALCFHSLGRIQDSYNIEKIMLTKKLPKQDKDRIEANMKTHRDNFGVK